MFAENYDVLIHGMLSDDAAYGQFCAYFIEHYPMHNGNLWAKFGRVDSPVTTNMHLESLHR